jgi:hypothetical protein
VYRIGAVDVVLHAVVGERYECDLRGIALELPSQVVPLVSSGSGAGDPGAGPFAGCIRPNIPVAGADVALCAENPAMTSVRLVGVELKRL